MGWLSKERVRVEMHRAATLCVPSYTETFGIVYAEAMKQEMAIVARSDTGIDGHGILELPPNIGPGSMRGFRKT